MNEAQKIEEQIKRVIAGYAMLPRGRTVVVGLSGGADSVALTHFLFTHRAEYGVGLLAAHVNHGLRGEAAARDEAFARAFCGGLGLAFAVRHADVAALAKERGLGLEDCGRQVRYDFFESLLPKGGRIATAHTMSDNTETVLLHLARGAGARGLSGIPAVRGAVVRPLLGVTRDGVEAYCAHYGLGFVKDESNQDRKFARNLVRLDVVPALRTLNPLLDESMARAARLLSADDALLCELAQKALKAARKPGGWELAPLRELPEPLLSRALLLAITEAQRETGLVRACSAQVVAQAVLAVREGTEMTAAGGIQIAARGNTLCVAAKREGALAWELPLILPKTALPDGRVLEIRVEEQEKLGKDEKFNKLLFHNLIAYDTIKNSGCVRTRRPGDFFRPAGRGVGKTLKKLFNEEAVPATLRERLLVLEQEGGIVWVEDFGPAEGAQARPNEAAAQIVIREK